jgi:hypothetical protein
MVDEFQDPDGNHFILLVSTQAGGTGLNLTAVCHTTVPVDMADCIGQQSRHLRSRVE